MGEMVGWEGRTLFLVHPYTEAIAYCFLHLDFPMPVSHKAIVIEIQVHPVWQILPRRKQTSVFTHLSGLLPSFTAFDLANLPAHQWP